MFGSEIIDVAIGVVFLFLMMSLICSAIVELIEAFLKRRAADLERGLKELLSDPSGTGLVKQRYDHPLINGLFKGTYSPSATRNLPSYIPARTFAMAIMDLMGPTTAANVKSGAEGASLMSASPTAVPAGGTVVPAPATATTAGLRAALLVPPPTTLKTALLSLIDAAGSDAATARQNIEDWYNASMDRVSGWFKRRTQFILLGIGIVLAAAVNADTIGFAQYLSTDKDARAIIVAQAEAITKATPAPGAAAPPTAGITPPAPKELISPLGWLQTHAGLPFGWHLQPKLDKDADANAKALYDQEYAAYKADWRRVPTDWIGWLAKIAGLLLTACAVTLGAPFWFDVLNKIMVVRSTIKPKEKSPDEPSKA